MNSHAQNAMIARLLVEKPSRPPNAVIAREGNRGNTPNPIVAWEKNGLDSLFLRRLGFSRRFAFLILIWWHPPKSLFSLFQAICSIVSFSSLARSANERGWHCLRGGIFLWIGKKSLQICETRVEIATEIAPISYLAAISNRWRVGFETEKSRCKILVRKFCFYTPLKWGSDFDPHPQPQNSLLRIFRLQPDLEQKFSLRRTCSGRKLASFPGLSLR